MNDLVQIQKAEQPTPRSARRGLFIRTFGCQMNEYDSQKVAGLLESNYQLVDSPEKAELVILNTCSVRDKPEQKLYSALGELAQLKRERPEMLIGVGGCVAQQEGSAIISRVKAVDFVYGTHNLSLVPALVAQVRRGLGPQVAVNYREDWEVLPFAEQAGSRVSAFVAISRGCNKNCSYCIVPTTRGVEVSRPLAEVLREVRWAVRAGAREVVLLGQTVNSYGRDLEPRTSFCELLQQVSEVTGLERIRFTSPHPQEIREDFLELVTTNPKICRHIHMPLQSGSDRILRAMNRNYRRKRYLEILTGIKERAPDMAFTTDIIVGFPGEQDEDFELTLEILELVRFQDSFSFAFSPRPGTAAAQLKDDVPHALKLERLQRWQSRQKQITSEGLQSWVGRCCEVLIERTSELDEQKLCGKTSQNITLNFEGGASESSGGSTGETAFGEQDVAQGIMAQAGLRVGTLVPALVTGIATYTLKGRVLPGSRV